MNNSNKNKTKSNKNTIQIQNRLNSWKVLGRTYAENCNLQHRMS